MDIKRIEKSAPISKGLQRLTFLYCTIFFVVGIFAYSSMEGGAIIGGLTLAVYAFVSIIVSLMFVIPFVGLILWLLNLFIWEIHIELAEILNLGWGISTGFAWGIVSIIIFIIGIILTLAIILGIEEKT